MLLKHAKNRERKSGGNLLLYFKQKKKQKTKEKVTF